MSRSTLWSVFRQLYMNAIACGAPSERVEERRQQFVEHGGASDEDVIHAQDTGKRLLRARVAAAIRTAKCELGLRALAAMVAENATLESIELMRARNAADGIGPETIGAAYDLGYAQFDAARNAQQVATA